MVPPPGPERDKAAAPGNAPVKYCPGCGKAVEYRLVAGRMRYACPDCSFVHWDNPKPVAITLVPASAGIVLVQRKCQPAAGSWALPGGYIEGHEHPEQAAAREVKEETGLNVEIDRLINVSLPTGGANEILFFYLASPVEQNPEPGDDAINTGIFKQDNLPSPIAFALHRQLIDAFFNGKL